MGIEKALLSPEQRQALHRSILGYLRVQVPHEPAEGAANADHVLTTVAQWLEIEEEDNKMDKNGDSYGGNTISSDAALLPRKWNSIVRLQRRIIELERHIRQLTDENETLLEEGTVAHAVARSSINWLPRSLPSFHIDIGAPVSAVKLHPILPTVFVATEQGKLQCYDLMNYTMPLASVQAHMRGITSIDVLVEESTHCLVVTASKDLHSKVFRFDGTGLQLIRTFTGHEHIVSHARIWRNRSDILVATCSRDLTCKIWDLSNGWCLKSFQAHKDWIRCLDVFGEYIVTGSNDSTVRLSHWPSGRGLSLGIGHDFPIESLKIIPLEENQATSDTSDQGQLASEQEYSQLGFKQVVSTSRDKNICIWSVPLPKFVPHRPPQPNPARSQFTLIKKLHGHSSWVRDVCVRGNHIFSCSDDRSIRIWDLGSGDCIRVLSDLHSGFINCLDLDSNGLNRELLVSGGADGQLQVFLK
ncbi:LAFE_0E05776g1_1 [Lachancea fermentati]|uniref:Nuclear distribution protein PAC1 n=1 Tax=Lachancea fermentati TaxID=4955 RepID=A0A1G4MD50_LACFM|nr:LAFE_0E05776g1_1 [Lachancea fermentati]